MNKEQKFSNMVQEGLGKYLPEKYSGYNVHVSVQEKTNFHHLTVYLTNPNNQENCSPIIPIQKYLDLYGNVKDEDILIHIAENVSTVMDDFYRGSSYKLRFDVFSWDDVKDKIFFRLVNTEKNKELLKDAIHEEIVDLSKVFRIKVDIDENGVISSILITKGFLKHWGVSEEQVINTANQNTPQLFPAQIVTPLQSINEFFFFSISNQAHTFGAGAFLYPEVKDYLQKMFPNGVYCIPLDSNQMCIADKRLDCHPLKEGLIEMNKYLDVEDYLSDEIYFFDSVNEELSIVKDNFSYRYQKSAEADVEINDLTSKDAGDGTQIDPGIEI